jgi:hypothetical protein
VPPERDDLAIELSESGTGIGQVLAMLYIHITSDTARTILIDEPNSFLHPTATRKLIEILREGPHQYIVSTHSTEILRIAEPSHLYLIREESEQSSVIPLNTNNLEHVRLALEDLGVKLSDLYGADQIVWVEGSTEQECFPLLARHAGIEFPAGTAYVAVRSTSELESTSGEALLDIYRQLSTVGTLLPRPIAFSFDSEDRPEQKKADLKRTSKGLVHFLPRRSYENYLLHAPALAHLMNSLESFSDYPIAEEVITTWLLSEGAERPYYIGEGTPSDITDPEWRQRVDAARLLEAMFQHLSAAKYQYQKTIHSVALTNWILANDIDHFSELFQYIRSLAPAP